MASSSVSQESLDINDDYELNARRSRIRTLRARGALPRAGDRDSETSGDRDGWDMNGDEVHPPQIVGVGGVNVDQVHDSPTRASAIQRAKDKRSRPNHLQKGKGIKDKRKLREKRRSTGVVHLASTESTGDSLDDDDDGEKVLTEAKRNTAYNEVIDADNPQTPSEVMRRIRQFQSLTVTKGNDEKSAGTGCVIQELQHQINDLGPHEDPAQVMKGFASRRNKSPSDLEADLEDNQDYDSTVSQSDSNLTQVDQSVIRDSYDAPQVPSRTYIQSKYSSESTQSFKPHISQRDQQGYVKPTAVPPSHYSVLSGYRTNDINNEPESPSYKQTSQTVSGPKSPKSPRSPNKTTNVVREPIRPVSSVLAKYQLQDRHEEPVGYRSRFRDRETGGVRGPIGQQFASSVLLNRDNKDDDIARKKLEKELEREKDENKRLQKVLEEKDRRIADLERQVAMMNRDLEDFEEETAKLQIENRALIQAVGQLSTNV